MHFEKQDYQEQCVENIIKVLEACDMKNNDFSNFSTAIGDLWQEKGYTQFIKKDDKKRLDILMETGTGKTFTYLKAIFEIHKQFDKKKFIIVVPRTAIKLGVIQNIELTRGYFHQEYKKYLKFIDYPKDGLKKITNDFLDNDDLCILLTTNSAFNSDKNKINQKSENLFEYSSIWQGIKKKAPIVIIDEPHLLKGSETQKGLDKLDNCLQMRFGATFPVDKKDEDHHLSNVIYSLDSISSFRKYLVKGITVHTVFSEAEQGDLKLLATFSRQKTFTVVYDINKEIFKKSLKIGEDIGSKTGLKHFTNIKATKIAKETVFLDNKTTLHFTKNTYELSDEALSMMISASIEKHFEKEEDLFKQNIKALSLFFIPNIKDFRGDNPRIKKIFEKLYREKRTKVLASTKDEKYKAYLQQDIDDEGKLQVHEGYFSGDKGTNDKKEADGVNIILKQKEKLLSFETPLRFIFSVWALQEGWDNPNIFTICKLADTAKDTSRRQQVGRGLRIAVNQDGSRLTYKKLEEKDNRFEAINNLDVIVSGKEREFIQLIQQEIQEASYSLVDVSLTLDKLKNLGLDDKVRSGLFTVLEDNEIIDAKGTIKSSIYEFLKNNKDKLAGLKLSEERYNQILKIFIDNRNSVKDGNKKIKKIKIRQNKWQEFKQLWETINKKSRIVYKNIDEETIISNVANKFNAENIEVVKNKIFSQRYNVQNDTIENKEETSIDAVDFFSTQKFDDFFNTCIKKEKLPFDFMRRLFNKIDKKKIKNNPKQAKERLLEILKESLHGGLLSSVSYDFLDTKIYPNELQNEKGHSKAEIPYTLLGKNIEDCKSPQHLLYERVCYDSIIEATNQKNDPEKINKNTITVFAKLPKISIPTPYKRYNPDFAYLIEKGDGKKLFLVVEAKGYKSDNEIPELEKQKIDYAKKFFKALNKVLDKDDITLCFKTRTSSQDLNDLIKDF